MPHGKQNYRLLVEEQADKTVPRKRSEGLKRLPETGVGCVPNPLARKARKKRRETSFS